MSMPAQRLTPPGRWLWRLLSLLLLLSAVTGAWAQSSVNYTFGTNATGSLALDRNGNALDMSTGTTQLVAGSIDTGGGTGNIGFDFVFMGSVYQQVTANSNGAMRMGSTAFTAGANDLTQAAPIIAPFWDDLGTSASGSVRIKTFGNAPNRVLVVEWQNMLIRWNSTTTGGDATYQARLYEGSGIIEFVYGSMNIGTGNTSAVTASIGFTTGTTDNQFIAVDNLSTYTVTRVATNEAATQSLVNTSTAGPIASLTSAGDGSRRVFSFVPGAAPTAPSNVTFSGVTATGLTLNFTDNASNETGFLVQRSTDNVTFTTVATLAANITTLAQTGLSAGTTYYYQVTALNEGQSSAAATGSQATSNPTISGTRTVGPGGTYATLTAALDDVRANQLAGNLILELVPTYVSTAEPAFPIVVGTVNGNSLGTSASRTITIRPQAGATGRVITSSSTTATISITGGQYVTFDGRPGGSGTTKELTLTNSTTSGPAVRFIDGGANNTLRYLTISGANTSTTSGVVAFTTSTVAGGNSNNLIEYCDLRDAATPPINLVYSSGTGGNENSSNAVQNSNLYNFFSASGTANAGINLLGSSNSWTISGNYFFKTLTTTPTGGGTSRAIFLQAGNGHTVSGNYIGGNAAPATPGVINGTWTVSTGAVSQQATRFIGIDLSGVGTTTATQVQGNVIGNFDWSSSSGAASAPGVWCGIQVGAGAALIGGATPALGNTIGAATGTGNITVRTTSTATSVLSFGVAISTAGAVTVQNNTIGSITTTLAASQTTANQAIISHGFVAIRNTSGNTLTVSNNLIGSLTTSNSIQAANASTSTGGLQVVTGIENSGTSSTATITNNTIANLSNNYAAAAVGPVRGILTSSGSNTISGNTVRGLSNTAPNAGTGANATIIGISQSSTAAGQTVAQNTVWDLRGTSATGAASSVIGIYYSGPTTGTNVINRNLIYGLTQTTAYTGTPPNATAIVGLQVAGGNGDVTNNMIRLGFDASGAVIATGYDIRGISKTSSALAANTNNFYHNSVYIGGSGLTGGSQDTYAFRRSNDNVDAVRNNVLVNARSNSGATGRHFAVALGAAATTYTTSHNVYNAPGTGGNIGVVGSTVYASLSAWQTATGDVNSADADPQFVDPTAATPDLHIKSNVATPVEGAGLASATVVDDFDGGTRSNLTPVDIGADAGNFIGGDLVAPTITYTPLTNTPSTANRAVTTISITDASGVNVAAGTAPRLYFRRLQFDGTPVDANAINDNTSSTDGWKYVEASNGTSPFSFTIDYSLLFGGAGVAPGQRIQYFVVAQDVASPANVGINAGVFASTPTSVALTTANLPTGTLNNYVVLFNLNGSYNVGTGQQFTSLTGAAGLFDALNNAQVTGALTVNVTSDLTEPGTIALNQFNEQPAASGFTLTIQADGTTERLISGTGFTGGLIRLNGADNVTITGGAGKYLRLRNTNTTNSPLLTFLNDATNNTISNCTLEGAGTGTSSATVLFSTSNGTLGNSNNQLTGNDIRNLSVAPNTVPHTAVYSLGTSAATNRGNALKDNTIRNFTNNGVTLSSTGNGDGWVIGGATAADGNRFYQEAARSTTLANITLAGGSTHVVSNNSIYQTGAANTAGFTGIYLSAGSGHTISSNTIGGSDNTAGGTALGVSGDTYGIRLAVGTTATTSVQSNRIRNLSNASTGGITFGIYATTGLLSIGTGSSTGTNTGNIIGDATASLGITAKYDVYPINIDNSSAGTAATVSGNTIQNVQVVTGAGSGSWIYGLGLSTVDKSTVQGNTVRDLSIAGGVTNGRIFGIIVAQSGGHDVLSNTVTNLTNGSASSNSNSTQTAGIVVFSTGAATVADNQVSNVALTGTNVASSATYFNLVTGISMGSTGSGGKLLRNRIWNVSSQAPAFATSPNVLDGVSGILNSDSYSTLTAANNQVALGSGSAAGVPVAGILNVSTGTGNAYYYNSVYLSGSGSADSYAFRRTGTAASGQLRNNIFYNERTGTGSHYAIGYAAAASWTATTSNYNLLVTADNAKVGNTAGTVRTFATWKVSSGGDANSSYYQPSAPELGGSAAGLFTAPATADLSINSGYYGTPSPLESGGVAVAGTVDTDYQGDIRQGSPGYAGSGTRPDIGADEYNGTILPVMVYSATAVTQISTPVYAGTTNQAVLRVEVTTTGSFNPLQLTQLDFTADGTTDLANISNARVYYTGTSSTFATSAQFGTGTVAPAFGPTGFSIIGTQTLQPGTNYFFLTYDVAAGSPSNNLVDATLTGVTIPAAPGSPFAIDPTVGAPAGARRILGPMNGPYTVGRTGGEDFSSITLALADLSTRGLLTTGSGVTFLLTNQAASTGAYDAANGETFPLTIGTVAGADASRRVTIRPQTGVTASITGSASKAIFLLDGADYVTVDGSNAPGGSTRNLSITNTSTSTTSAVVYAQTGASTNSATNNVIQNLVVTGSGPSQTLMGIGFGSSTVSGTTLGTSNNNNQVLNNSISRVQYGIYSQGASASTRNTGTVISGNVMTTAAPDNVRFGILLGHDSGAQLTLNTIGGLTNSGDGAGISLGALTSISNSPGTGNAVVNATLSRNAVTGVVSTGTSSAVGILLSSGTTGTTLTNNLVSGIVSNATGSDLTAGILLGGGTATLYHNTVALTGTRDVGSTLPSSSSVALALAGSNPAVTLRNNILVNTQTTAGTGKSYALGIGYSTYTNLTSSNNDLFTEGANAQFASVASSSFAGTNTATLTALQTATNQEANSTDADPLFVGSTLVPNACALNNTALAGTGVTEDYTGATRSSTPDIGAYEFNSTVGTDFRLVALTAPVAGSSSCRTATETVTVQVRNNGCEQTLSPANPLTLNVAVTGPTGPLPSLTLSITSGTLAPGATVTYNVSTAFDMTFGGTYTFTPSLSYAGDQVSSNDALAAQTATSTNPALTVSPNVAVCTGGSTTLTASAPQYLNPNKVIFSENFEGATNGFTTTSTGSQPLSGFTLVTAGYKLGGSGTPANGTAYNGPDGNAAGHYYVSDSDKYGSGTGGVNSTITTLTSPSFSTVGYSSATLRFQHFYDNYTSDVTAQVEYSVNGGAWTLLPGTNYKAGATDIGSSSAGVQAAVALPAAALGQANVQVRFNYETSYGYNWAIDNVSVSGATLEDATFTWTPAAGLSATTGTSVTATPTATTTYTVTANYPALNCSSSKQVTVTVSDQTTWTGTQSTDWFDGRNWSACVPSNVIDAVVPTVVSGNYPAIGTGTAAVRSIQFADNGRLDMTGGTLNVYQDWTRTGSGSSSVLTGGTVAFVGAGPQQLSAAPSFFNLTVNKSADTLRVAANPTVTGALTMTSGIVKTYTLSTTNQINLAGTLTETATSFVLGNVVTSATLGTDGASSTFGGIGLTLTAHGTGGVSLPGATTVTRMTGKPMYGMSNSTSIRRQFNIQPAIDTNLNVDMVFGYGDSAFELQGIGEGSLTLFSNAGVPGGWKQEGYTSRDAAANTVTLLALNHLSLWTLGSESAPLPVSLTSFEAQRQGANALLTWTTAQEKNNRGFEVQVSTDGRTFRPLGFVASEAPNSTTARHYRFVDTEAGKQGLRYYRLQQLDQDGTKAYFGPRTVQFEQATKLAAVAFPNPFVGRELTLEVTAPTSAATELLLLDALGRTVLRQTVNLQAGVQRLPLQLTGEPLPSGAYILRLTSAGQTSTLRVVKQ